MDGASEAAGVQQASGDVVVEVAEFQGYAPEGLEPSVDGLGGSVRAVLPVEEREDVAMRPPRIAVSSSAASER